jgi:hypothetical protein
MDWPDFIQRLEDSHLVVEFTFHSQGLLNQTQLSEALVESLAEHQIVVPAHEDEQDDIRFILCQYKRVRAPPARRAGYKNRVIRDDNAQVNDWTVASLRKRHPDVKHRGLPMILIGTLLWRCTLHAPTLT